MILIDYFYDKLTSRMSKKIKDTKLGAWLRDKAPSVLGTVGDLLPDQGALGLVKNLLDLSLIHI